jgi:hypothetical protein
MMSTAFAGFTALRVARCGIELEQPDESDNDGRAEQRHEDRAETAELVGEEDEHTDRSATGVPWRPSTRRCSGPQGGTRLVPGDIAEATPWLPPFARVSRCCWTRFGPDGEHDEYLLRRLYRRSLDERSERSRAAV